MKEADVLYSFEISRGVGYTNCVKKAQREFCYLEPDYPKKAYIATLFLIYQEKINIFPLRGITTSLDETASYIKEIVDDFREKTDQIEIPEDCSLIPITFSSLLPLKKEYWDNPTDHYMTEERERLFINLYRNPLMHEMLVTPEYYDEDSDLWYLDATLPLKAGTPEPVIEQFMLSSTVQVDYRAKHAAIYTLSEPKRFNWLTKEVSKVERKKSPEEMILN